MAKLIFAMTQSLDGYVAAVNGALEPPLSPPDDALFRHFTEFERSLSGVVYGRRIYELMRYWEDDQSDWTPREREFARVWRAHPKWVVSRSLTSVGSNAVLIKDSVFETIRALKSQMDGVLAVAGPETAAGFAEAGLIDEFHLYMRPVVLGSGKPYFAGTRPHLRFIAADRVGDDAVRLRYEAV